MLINLGAISVKYEDFLNIRIILQNEQHLVQATISFENKVTPINIYTAKDAEDAVRYIDQLVEHNNCSFTRYTNEKVKPAPLQLWPVQSENPEGVSGKVQHASGSHAPTQSGGHDTASAVEDSGSDVMESGQREA